MHRQFGIQLSHIFGILQEEDKGGLSCFQFSYVIFGIKTIRFVLREISLEENVEIEKVSNFTYF